MSDIPKVCFDKILPWELRNPKPRQVITMSDGKTRAVMPINKIWPNGTKLSVRFLGGTKKNRDLVRKVAPEWSKHANLEFDFNDDPSAQIRISFIDDGAWSYVGTDNLDIPNHAATMNFGFIDEGTILHEFGHAIGLGHEHQNPDGGIEWDRDAVIAAVSAPPNSWSVGEIEHNILKKYTIDQVRGTEFDGDSIMLYSFPASWTTNGVSTHANESLSALDRDFIGTVYPKGSPSHSDSNHLSVHEITLTEGEISEPGGVEFFNFDVDESGIYIVETKGPSDITMKLFGPDSETQLIASDDDSGTLRNARIEAQLAEGNYVVEVRHFAENTGRYGIAVSKE